MVPVIMNHHIHLSTALCTSCIASTDKNGSVCIATGDPTKTALVQTFTQCKFKYYVISVLFT